MLVQSATVELPPKFHGTPMTSMDLFDVVRREAVEQALQSVAWYRHGIPFVGHPEAETLCEVQVERVMRDLRRRS